MKIKDGEIRVNIRELLEDETILRELAKTAVFDEKLIACLSEVLVSGQVDWQDDEDDTPWWSTWTGKGETFEAARRTVANLADQTAQKLITDLEIERDKLYAEREAQRRTIWEYAGTITELQREIRQLREGGRAA
jgi:hypothetical protein